MPQRRVLALQRRDLVLQRADQRVSCRELVEGWIPWGRIAHHGHSTIRARRCLPLTPHTVTRRARTSGDAACARDRWDHLNDLSSMLDLGDCGLLQTVEHWRGKHPGSDLLLVHDTSKMIERNRSKWEAVLDPTNPAAIVGQDRRTIEFPLPVRGLRIAESHEFVELQVADVVAGAACAVMRARAIHSDNEYATQLVDLGLLDLIGGGVWPTSAISPEQLETEGPALADSADFIGRLIARRKPPGDG
jgi:hypothetical protein